MLPILLFAFVLSLYLPGCTAPPDPLVIPAKVHVILFMPPGIHQQLRWDIQAFLRSNGLESMWVDMTGKNDADMEKRIQAVIAQSQVHERMTPLTLIGFSKGNAGVLAAMGYWGQSPLANKLTAIFLAPPPDAILKRQHLGRVAQGHRMVFVYGAQDQSSQRRLLQQSQVNRQYISEITVPAGHSLRQYWQGSQAFIINFIAK
ncbi:MAG: hypothetical protein ETSY2_14045 [Candidatus Entotheonella gemina]|uniref:Phospholipase/carboxylesterase/thioesterase domain-containing protein n=1 Tax=Candidatus Entotheonella gemina TaxID=1429439 RepID=W4MBE1_9BACT|nr:MAG: hypothetical protein ETSY2_14045 [Candidatus Entotheonella gemina]